ncbi:MAG TPA: sodium:proton antiporter [Porphyromonadaceae bacterium]|nr:sodium:proton antiporter [Porphyromonadaceae bacterium]
MKKVLLFSFFLVFGLILSQIIPTAMEEYYPLIKSVGNTLLYVCLAFIMINVGREFELDKSRWRSYTSDYFIAMATAAMPWFLIALYYVFVLLPSTYWGNWDAWKENLLLSRFAAPTSAGILFTMLAAAGLKNSWIYKKIQVLAIFDDLDTILLMIPLQIMMIGMKWQLFVVIFIVCGLLIVGWKRLGVYDIPQNWKAILTYSIVTFILCQGIYFLTKSLYGEEGSIHIEVLLPAFILGMVMKQKHLVSKEETVATNTVSYLFMFLVGLSMPYFLGLEFTDGAAEANTITGSQHMLPWSTIILHVVLVSLLSNIGKLFPVLFYRDRAFSERLALSIGMFTRGEVGAGIIFIAIGYNLGGPVLVISVLSIVLNLLLTGLFIVWVKQLAMRQQQKEQPGLSI